MSFKTRIRNKRDTASNWETNNPVLLDGELIVVDTNAGDIRFKIGDGTKTYTQLPFQDEVVYNALSGKAEAKDLTTLEGRVTTIDGEIDILQTESADRVVATDDGELTNVLPDMFGGHTPDEYMLKAEMPEVEKSDWSVNDEDDAAYIKNRTHWTDDDGTVHKIDEKYLPDVGVRSWNDLTDKPFGTTTTRIVDHYPLDNPSDMSVLREPAVNTYQLTISDGFGVGDTVVVTWNGQKYSCEAYALDGAAAVGNAMYFEGKDPGAGEPFLIGCMAPTLVVLTFDEGAVVSIDIEKTKKMSGKYVDGMGWSEFVEYTYDGDTNSPNYHVVENYGGLYKVSDTPLTMEELVGATVTARSIYYDESHIEHFAYASGKISVDAVGGDDPGVNVYVVDTGDFCLGVIISAMSDSAVLERGLYFVYDEEVMTVGLSIETIHPIAPKYLPTGGFGYSETVALLKASNAEEYEHPDFGKAWLIENAPKLTVGETYTVTYNGNDYNCVCQPAPEGLSQDTEAVAMGNFSVAGGENTGEPFAMMISCMFNRVDVIDLSGASAVKVAITKEKINKIDKKYLPSVGSGGGCLVITVDTTSGSMSANMPFDEARNLLFSGAPVVFKQDYGSEVQLYNNTYTTCLEDKIWIDVYRGGDHVVSAQFNSDGSIEVPEEG